MRPVRAVSWAVALATASGLLLLGAPATALTASSVSSGTPVWSSAVLKSGASTFTSSAYGTDTYTVTTYLVRTASRTAPVCSSSLGCSTTSGQTVLKASSQLFVSVPKSTTKSIATVSVNCGTGSTTRFYWRYIRVTGLSGVTKPIGAMSGALSGRFC